MITSRSRYLTINSSEAYRDETGATYPDIFSFPINQFSINDIPLTIALTEDNINRFDLLMAYYYGKSDYDDIVLWLNKINYIHDVPVGTEIFLPSKKDIESFYEEYYTQ